MAFVSDTVRILTDSELEQAEYTEGEEIVVQDSSDILSDTVNYFPSPARTEALEVFHNFENHCDPSKEFFSVAPLVKSDARMVSTPGERADELSGGYSFHIPNFQDAMTAEQGSMNEPSSGSAEAETVGQSSQDSFSLSLTNGQAGDLDQSMDSSKLNDSLSLFRTPAVPRMTYKNQIASPRASLQKKYASLTDNRSSTTIEAKRALAIKKFQDWNTKRKRHSAGMEELVMATTWFMYTTKSKRLLDYDPFKLPLGKDFSDYPEFVRKPQSLMEIAVDLTSRKNVTSALSPGELNRIPLNAVAYNNAGEPIANEAQKMLACITRITKLARSVNAEINDLSDLGVDNYRRRLQTEVAVRTKANAKGQHPTSLAVDQVSESRRHDRAPLNGSC